MRRWKRGRGNDYIIGKEDKIRRTWIKRGSMEENREEKEGIEVMEKEAAGNLRVSG